MIALVLSRTTTTLELGYWVVLLSHLYGAAQMCPSYGLYFPQHWEWICLRVDLPA